MASYGKLETAPTRPPNDENTKRMIAGARYVGEITAAPKRRRSNDTSAALFNQSTAILEATSPRAKAPGARRAGVAMMGNRC